MVEEVISLEEVQVELPEEDILETGVEINLEEEEEFDITAFGTYVGWSETTYGTLTAVSSTESTSTSTSGTESYGTTVSTTDGTVT